MTEHNRMKCNICNTIFTDVADMSKRKHGIVNCPSCYSKNTIVLKDNKLISKQCSKCGEIKDINEFGRHRGHKDGFTSWCNNCRRNKYYGTNKKIFK